MTTDLVVDIARQTLWMIVKVSAPMLLASLVIGLIISIFQTVTSIQEQTLTFVPKLVAVFFILALFGNWILNSLATFTIELFSHFSEYIR